MLLSFRSFLRLLCGLSLWQRDIYDAAMYICKKENDYGNKYGNKYGKGRG